MDYNFPASNADQLLCKQHQLKRIRRAQATWMKQRQEELSKQEDAGATDTYIHDQPVSGPVGRGEAQRAAPAATEPCRAFEQSRRQPVVEGPLSTDDGAANDTTNDREWDEMQNFLAALELQQEELDEF